MPLHSLKGKRLWAALAVLVVLVLIARLIWPRLAGEHDRKAAAPPVPVTVAEAKLQDMPDEVASFGQVKSLNAVSIQARVTTRLDKVLVDDGQMVKAGQPLFKLDDREFVSALNQAKATLDHDQAQAEYARVEDKRNLSLLSTKTVSQDTYDQVHATYLEALGSQAMSEAAVAEARLKLEYCAIASPIDGRLGKVNVKDGNLVTENGTELVSIQRLSPIRISFFVQESRLNQLRTALAEKEAPQVFIDPKDGGGRELAARLVFMDNQVDPATGTVTVEAEYPNDKMELWPGQYVNARLRLGLDKNALTIPESAARTGPDGKDLTAVVGPDNKAQLRKITVIRRVGDSAMVRGDLKAGEKVVMDGYQRLSEGSAVEVQK